MRRNEERTGGGERREWLGRERSGEGRTEEGMRRKEELLEERRSKVGLGGEESKEGEKMRGGSGGEVRGG